MSENVRKDRTLTPKQIKAAEALAVGASVEEASLAARVTPRTLLRWRAMDEFVAGLRAMVAESVDQHQRALTGELGRNREVMREARDDPEADWPVRLRAAAMLEASLLKWREQDLERRILALEHALLDR